MTDAYEVVKALRPAPAGIAILRHQHLDISILMGRPLVHVWVRPSPRAAGR